MHSRLRLVTGALFAPLPPDYIPRILKKWKVQFTTRFSILLRNSDGVSPTDIIVRRCNIVVTSVHTHK